MSRGPYNPTGRGGRGRGRIHQHPSDDPYMQHPGGAGSMAQQQQQQQDYMSGGTHRTPPMQSSSSPHNMPPFQLAYSNNNNNLNNNTNNMTGGHGQYGHHTHSPGQLYGGDGGGHGGRSRDRERHEPLDATLQQCLSVMDMGLDFRSYQTFLTLENATDPQQTNINIMGSNARKPLLSNVIPFRAERVPDMFEPTVGLLVTVVHMYAVSYTSEIALTWLNMYRAVQQLYKRQCEEIIARGARDERGISALREGMRCADDAINEMDNVQRQHPDRSLVEKLLHCLDGQSGLGGGRGDRDHSRGSGQFPSQRTIPPAPKGTFCNLYLSDHKCNQEFSCNQIHLHQSGPFVKHRLDYHVRLVKGLYQLYYRTGRVKNISPNAPFIENEEEIFHRLKDSIFYAKYGHKVTIKYHNTNMQFFKTLYTPQRLALALRQHTGPVLPHHVRPQDTTRPTHSTKAGIELSPTEVEEELRTEVNHVLEHYQAEVDRMNEAQAQAVHNKSFNSSSFQNTPQKQIQGHHMLPQSAQPLQQPQPVTVALTADGQGRSSSAGNTVPTSPQIPGANSSTGLPPPMSSSQLEAQGSLGDELPDPWEVSVRELVRNAGIQEHAVTDSLLMTLQTAGSTPLTPSENLTPLMQEVQMQRYGSDMD